MSDLFLKYQSGDITPEEYIRELERRLVERSTALADSETRYRAVFENSTDMVFFTRPDGTIVDANPAACQALGYTRAELCSLGRAGITHPDENLAEAEQRRASESRVHTELTFVRKDGSTFLAEVDSVILNPEWPDWTTFVTARDITRRRQAEGALRTSEERFRAIWDITTNALVLSDQDGTVTAVNPAYCALYGYAPEDLLGKNYAVIFPEAERESARQQYLAVFQNPALPPAFEASVQQKSGQRREVESRIAFLMEGQQRKEMLSIVRDITERKQAERERERLLQEIQHQKDLLEHLIQHSPVGIALLQGPDCRFVLVNPAQRKLFPTIPNFLGRTVAEVWPDQQDVFLPILTRVAQTGEPYYATDAAWRTDKGAGMEEVYYSFSYTPVYNGSDKIEGILVLSLETTPQVKARQMLEAELEERKRVEAALQESEERFRAMADGTPVMIWVHDAAGTIEFTNRAYNDFFGVTLEQVRQEGWQPLVHPDDIPGYVDVFMDCLREQKTFRAQCRVSYYDGEWRWIDSHGQPRFSATGEFIGMAGSSLDVTDHKSAEEAISHYVKQMEQLNQELAFANRELKDFTYAASHDLQEPLRKVTQFGNLLQKNANAVLSGESRDYLERMLDAATRMQKMISGLLDYSRITWQGNSFVPVDLAQVAREVLSDLEVRIAQTHGVVEIQSLPVIQADPLLMRQLLQNLIANALKFHKADTPPVVKIWCEGGDMPGNADQFVYLHIADNGIGFEEQYLDKMFLPFMRLHGRGSYEGSGIGLSICRKIVERHGGTITAKSSPGLGATFIVALPLQEHPGNG